MKFSNIAAVFVAIASSAAAESLTDVLDNLAARSEGASFYHFGDDHVVRAISSDFRVLGRHVLEDRHAVDFAAELGQDLMERAADVDEAAILADVEKQRRYVERRATGTSPPPELVERQNCVSNPFCHPGCGGANCHCVLSGLVGARCRV